MSDQPRKPYEKLQRRWAERGEVPTVALGEERVAALEQRFGVRLPDDFREYLLFSAPAVDDEMDFEGTTWWPIERIKSLAEECPNHSSEAVIQQDAGQYLIFADVLVWCSAWAIACGSANRGRIISISSKDRFVADSFAEFVDRYLVNSQPLE